MKVSDHPSTEVHEEVPEQLSRIKSSDEPVCRICFDIETDQKILIAPCKCAGSIRSVHEECLKMWIMSSDQNISSASCDICKEKFKMEIEFARTCSCTFVSEECFKIFIFPLAMVIISTILAIVILYLIEGIQEGSLGTEEKVYFALVITACIIILVTLAWILVKSILATCCPLKMKDWRILTLQNAAIFEETFDIPHDELLSREKLESLNLNREKFNRRNVIVPILQLNRENFENSAFLSNHFPRSGPQTERLPDVAPENVIQRMATARILK
jgi:hypothetical protein